MKLSVLYREAVEVGKRYDPRGSRAPVADLNKIKKAYDSMTDGERKWFDMDTLWNPYLDSRPVCGDEDGKDPDFSYAMVFLDEPGSGHILAAKDIKADLLISHHPDGKAKAGLHKVLEMQIAIWRKYGVKTRAVAKVSEDKSLKHLYSLAVVDNREDNIGDITENIPDFARHYKMPWIVLHTVADNCLTTYLQAMMNCEKPKRLKDIVDLLRTIPEYAQATRELIGPRIVAGEAKSKTGKIVVDMTGGQDAPDEIFASFANSGINTIVNMHTFEDWYKEAADHQIQIVCAGHAPSDNLAMNLLFDEVLPPDVMIHSGMGGYRRFSHKDEDWQKKYKIKNNNTRKK